MLGHTVFQTTYQVPGPATSDLQSVGSSHTPAWLTEMQTAYPVCDSFIKAQEKSA